MTIRSYKAPKHKHPFDNAHRTCSISVGQIRRCAEEEGVAKTTHCGSFNYRTESTARPMLSGSLSTTDPVHLYQIGIGTNTYTSPHPDSELIRGLPAEEGAASAYREFIERTPRSRCHVEIFDAYDQLRSVVKAHSNHSYGYSVNTKMLGENFLWIFKQVEQ